MNMEILSLTFYPVKSLAGISLQSMEIVAEGPLLDRNWMIVDESGKFVTQREYPAMARIQPEWKNQKLFLHGKDSSLEIPFSETNYKQVTVWKDSLRAKLADDLYNQWISKELGAPLFLVRMDQNRIRDGIPIRFSDAHPILVCNQKSLEDLNSRLENPIEMNRFRANIVVNAKDPWEEDGWKSLESDAISLAIEKPCSRCSITTVDPNSGIRGQEPLKTLSNFRRFEKKVYFGMYCSVKTKGKISVGMKLKASFR
jgi:uncharacterized protein YcbX